LQNEIRIRSRGKARAGYNLPGYSLPLVEGTASALRGSISIASRNARANPLKQDSTM
jgi:hypothetical protein